MTSHLSSDQICRWLAGERGYKEQQHLRACPACLAEVNEFQNALTGFRRSLETSPVPAVSYSRTRQTLPRWILAAAALAIMVAAPVYWNARHQRETEHSMAEQTETDDLLLERVNAGLSRAVPSSMEPLMQLISKGEK
jgi:hypothetical protein